MNLMEVNVAGDGTVQTADGQPLEISPLQVPSQVRGRKVIMGMRPEHMLRQHARRALRSRDG